jgi:hypothetical protein
MNQKTQGPSQILLRAILDLVPQPLGYALIVGVFLLAGAAGVIGRAYTDFDLRLILGSLWFLLALGAACAVWLVATVCARKRLGWPRLIGFAVLFLLGVAFSASGAWQMSQYQYNDLGFYQQRHWHRLRAQGDARPAAFEWRIQGVKPMISSLRFQVRADPDCQYTSFQPVENPAKGAGSTVGWNVCEYNGAGANYWIVQNFGRGGSVVFTLVPANAPLLPANCELPTVIITTEHCPE